jgi:hypothetical protein
LDDGSLRQWLPLIFGAWAYVLLAISPRALLSDPDTYWHIAVGHWIFDHRGLPHSDPFSFTMSGADWISNAWLSEILYSGAFETAGWAGPVILAAASVALSFFLLTQLLLDRLPTIAAVILVGAVMLLAAPHMSARPHVLVFPILVIWANALVQASEQGRAPSLWNLPAICLWANLHGSFTVGLALIAPFALEALWNSQGSARRELAFQWFRFGVAALAASCITPYGPETILATVRVFHLGAALSTITEWSPSDLSSFDGLSLWLLGGLGFVLYSGLKLPLLRILVLLAIMHETLSHKRYADVLAFVGPLIIAKPLAQHFANAKFLVVQNPSRSGRVALGPFAVALVIVTALVVPTVHYAPPPAPRLAVEKIRELKADHVLNHYDLGGYLIYEGVPTFIDGRAELYGAAFLTRYVRAISLSDVADFVRLLDEYKIDATLLAPSTQAVGLLDRLDGWERVYSDKLAVVHYRRTTANPSSNVPARHSQ